MASLCKWTSLSTKYRHDDSGLTLKFWVVYLQTAQTWANAGVILRSPSAVLHPWLYIRMRAGRLIIMYNETDKGNSQLSGTQV